MKIIEKDGKVIIDGTAITGYIYDEACPKCGTKKIYSDTYDAIFCPSCNIWLEGKCPDSKCNYCRKRPPKPPVKQ